MKTEALDRMYKASVDACPDCGPVVMCSFHSQVSEERAALVAAAQPWKCRAQPTADPPQDCNFPFCGCDPGAEKVIDTLLECGWVDQDEHLRLVAAAQDRTLLEAAEFAIDNAPRSKPYNRTYNDLWLNAHANIRAARERMGKE